jgi:hypothetical protein
VLHLLTSYGLLILACGYALLRGGWPERWTASMLLVGVVATTLVYLVGNNHYVHADFAILTVDLIFLCGLIWIVLRADRFWPIPFTALHALSVLGHMLRIAETDLPALIYKIMLAAPIYPMLVLLVWGTRRAAVRRVGRPQRSWRGFFPSVESRMRNSFREP